jgi:hypothetical protein
MHSKKTDKVLMPIDITCVNDEYFIVTILTEKTFYKEPFFIDSLALKYNIKLKGVKYEKKSLVRSLDFLNISAELVLLPIGDFITDFIDISPLRTNLFIFHTSRCGSTLATQMMNAASSLFVISEPPIINRILDPHLKLPIQTIASLLKSAMNLINICAPDNAARVIVKFRSWNILFLKEILNVFPGTPWFFIHRDGKEVIPSILENPPGWLRAQETYAKYFSKHLNLGEYYCKSCDSVEFASRLIGVFCQIAYENKSKVSKFIDYREIRTALINSTEYSLGYSFTDFEKDKMGKRCLFDSKKMGHIKFIDDSIKKVQTLSVEQISLIEKYIEPKRLLLFNL